MNQYKGTNGCNLGGDTTDNCKDCVYSVEYKEVDGICVKKTKEEMDETCKTLE